MARRLVVLAEEAEAEARSAFLWYFERNPAVADRFDVELTDAMESLADAPEIGAEIEAGIRRFLLRRFPYGLLYTLEGDQVLVVSVMHLRRRPGYWKTRRR